MNTHTRHYEHWIAGRPTAPHDGEYLIRANPATGRSVAEFARGSAADAAAALREARAAHQRGTWNALGPSGRAAVLRRFAQLVRRDLEGLAGIESDEVGKTLAQARGEIGTAAELIEYAASLAHDLKGSVADHLGDGHLVGLALPEPCGVVVAIAPWNFPAVALMQKVAFALAAGCVVVAKPSEYTSGTALEMAALATQSGLPDGAWSVVTGTGPEIGDALVGSDDVDVLTFTGSTRTSRRLAELSTNKRRRLLLELGGKGATIVMPDADLDRAAAGAAMSFTINQGETCSAGTRILVHQDIAEDFEKRLHRELDAVTVGDPRASNSTIGAMIHREHTDVLLDRIGRARERGVRVSYGGSRADVPALPAGQFLQPTVLSDVATSDELWNEELFGPVVCLSTFADLTEAVRSANDSPYGLAHSVWTSDLDTAWSAVRHLRSGTVWVNTTIESPVQVPFGGRKDSGMGMEKGGRGLWDYLEEKAIVMRMGDLR